MEFCDGGELEGTLNKIVAYAQLTHSPITIEMAQKAIDDMMIQKRKVLSSEFIQEVVAKYFNIDKLGTKELAHVEKWDRTRSPAGNYKVGALFLKDFESPDCIYHKCFNAPVAGIVAGIHGFSLKKAPCILFIESHPEPFLILPERL